ncbi:8053_t:CDS:1 [Ambispora gerdemannii]|uniref:Protein YOP1 n=1 Tax=Ambispora gerdemannii TaxID=144530 RepID=A0A9N8VDV0_9GLOM|nr:8053_t:CDS:1 [Ambispora gerdemannii]
MVTNVVEVPKETTQRQKYTVNLPATSSLESALTNLESRSPLNLTQITNFFRQEFLSRFAAIENWYASTWLHRQLVRLGIPELYLSLTVAVTILLTTRHFYKKSVYLFTNLVGVIYPAYRSIKVLDEVTTNQMDNAENISEQKQWLSYWTIYGCIQVGDNWSKWLLEMFPGYNFIKLAFLYWAQNDRSKGASVVFDHIIKPLIYNPSSNVKKELKQRQRQRQNPQHQTPQNQTPQHQLRKSLDNISNEVPAISGVVISSGTSVPGTTTPSSYPEPSPEEIWQRGYSEVNEGEVKPYRLSNDP